MVCNSKTSSFSLNFFYSLRNSLYRRKTKEILQRALAVEGSPSDWEVKLGIKFFGLYSLFDEQTNDFHS